MINGKMLTQLAQEIERQTSSMKDYIVPSDELEMKDFSIGTSHIRHDSANYSYREATPAKATAWIMLASNPSSLI